MSEAGLHINESLDFDTACKEVVDAARSLTASHNGPITLLGEAGLMPHRPRSHQRGAPGLRDTLEGGRLFEHLGGIEDALPVSDTDNHLGARGMPGSCPPCL